MGLLADHLRRRAAAEQQQQNQQLVQGLLGTQAQPGQHLLPAGQEGPQILPQGGSGLLADVADPNRQATFAAGLLGICEPCQDTAECATGVCASPTSGGGAQPYRCLPACTTDEAEQEAACGFFGNTDGDEPPPVNDRLWLCYDHGVCGPIDAPCSRRFTFPARMGCEGSFYCGVVGFGAAACEYDFGRVCTE